jgi:hypothetical protein
MMLAILAGAFLGLLGMWLLVVAVIPPRLRLWLATHPLAFLMVHIPFMLLMTSIGGEGIIFGVSNLLAGIVAQLALAGWGVKEHGLSWTGKKTPKYYYIHGFSNRNLDMLIKRQQERGL